MELLTGTSHQITSELPEESVSMAAAMAKCVLVSEVVERAQRMPNIAVQHASAPPPHVHVAMHTIHKKLLRSVVRSMIRVLWTLACL